MTEKELNHLYFEWLCDMACEKKSVQRRSYQKLLGYLHNVEFTYTIPMDGNRAEDGVNLRYRFGSENKYGDTMIASYLDNSPCSILEMMTALALRCEEHIMDDPEVGNRTSLWFWGMIDSLGLIFMTDSRFDEAEASEIIARFLNREYQRNGEGGLFTVSNCRRDLRSVDIWYQMCWYLDSVI